MACSWPSTCYPGRDELLARYDRWVAERLGEFATGTDLKVLSQFSMWALRRGLVARSEAEPLRDAQITNATQKLRVGAFLLAWLHQRGQELGDARQADIDEWFATPPTTHALAATFLRWAMKTKHCPKLVIPPRRGGTSPVLDHAARLDILARLLDPTTGRLEHRVAAMLLVLFGQPFNRIAALTVDDVVVDTAEIGVRLGEGVSPVPPPFAAMVHDLLVARPNLNTATNPTSQWFFPAAPPTVTSTRTSCGSVQSTWGSISWALGVGALRQLVLDCPPPVVAELLGTRVEHLTCAVAARPAQRRS